MKSLGRAAKANLEGTTLLDAEKPVKALKHFRAGLKKLNQDSVDSLPSAMDDESYASLIVGTSIVAKPIRLNQNSASFAHQKLVDASVPLFGKAFVFADDGSATMTTEKHRFCSAVLVYNTALALHQKAGKEEDNKDTYLKALVFYNEAKNILLPMLEEPDCFYIIQEIMKNQVDIYYRLDELDNVRKAWEQLAELTKEHTLVGGAYAHDQENRKVEVAMSA